MTSTSVTHTPGPWTTAGVTNPQTNPRMSVWGPRQGVWGPRQPGSESGEWIAKDIRPANAEFIVRACNAYEELLEAVRWVEAFLQTVDWTDNTSEQNAADIRVALEAAIAKAEGR